MFVEAPLNLMMRKIVLCRSDIQGLTISSVGLSVSNISIHFLRVLVCPTGFRFFPRVPVISVYDAIFPIFLTRRIFCALSGLVIKPYIDALA